MHVCTEAWKLVTVLLKRPGHARQTSAVIFPALYGRSHNVQQCIFRFSSKATAVANVT